MTTLVQNKSGTAAAASVTVVLSSPTTAGNTLLAGIGLTTGNTVFSIVDSTNNRWIQTSYASSNGGDAEIWQARAIQGGTASVVIVFTPPSALDEYDSTDAYDSLLSYDGNGASINGGINVSEWNGLFWQDPLDQWSQNLGTSASITPQTVTPRTSGDLVLAVAASSASVGGPVGPYTTLGMGSNANFAMAYEVASGASVDGMFWNTGASATWATCEASFVAGAAGINPLLQFPEVLVELSPSQDYQAAFKGTAVWTNVSHFVESMQLGPIGRMHLLDRVQSSPGSFVMNGREGTFNPWNSQSFLWPYALDPMTPIKVTASYTDGQTHAVYFGYAQSYTPNIIDSQNVTVTIDSFAIFQMLSLAYLANNSYAQALLSGN